MKRPAAILEEPSPACLVGKGSNSRCLLRFPAESQSDISGHFPAGSLSQHQLRMGKDEDQKLYIPHTYEPGCTLVGLLHRVEDVPTQGRKVVLVRLAHSPSDEAT